MRITISWEESKQLRHAINELKEPNDIFLLLNTKLNEAMQKEPSQKLINAPKKATETRVKNAKLKIFNALNLMRLEGRKISVNAVAREAGVSYNTAKKYEATILGKEKNT